MVALQVLQTPFMAGRRGRLISPPKAEKVDHISRLPDAIIHRIFSFLPFKDVVKTGVLSRKWRFAWTSTPYIDLSVPKKDDVAFIVRALRRCTATKMEKFHLNSPKSGSNVLLLLNCWNPFDSARKVEDASLASGYRYHLPKILCDCASLVSLRVSRCRFSGDTIVTWPSLKKLCLHDVWLDNDIMMKILGGCPTLESLVLCFSSSNCNIQINSESLRELVIETVFVAESSLDIWAPNLLSLRLSGPFLYAICRLKEVSSLAEAELNFHRSGVAVSPHFLNLFMLFLKQLQHVPKITIRSCCLEVLSFAKREEMECLPSRWRNIIVHTTACKRDLLGMAYLLQSSPLLERLVMRNPKSCNFKPKKKNPPELYDFDERQFRRSQKEFYCVRNHLKRVEIVGFEFGNKNSKPLLALARFLLEEAIGLEKMIIDAELRRSLRRLLIGPHDLWGVRDVIHLQEGCQKGSQNAEVIVNYHLNGLPYELRKQK